MIHWFTLYTLETCQLNSGSWLWHIYNILMGMAELSMLLLTWMLVACAWYIDVCMCLAMYMSCGYIYIYIIPFTKLTKEFKLDLRDPKLHRVQGKSHHENYYLNTTWTQPWLITRQLIESAFCWYKIHLDMILYDSSHLEIGICWIIQ